MVFDLALSVSTDRYASYSAIVCKWVVIIIGDAP